MGLLDRRMVKIIRPAQAGTPWRALCCPTGLAIANAPMEDDTVDDFMRELTNLYTQLRNMQRDIVQIGVIVIALLIAILALGGYALHHFW